MLCTPLSYWSADWRRFAASTETSIASAGSAESNRSESAGQQNGIPTVEFAFSEPFRDSLERGVLAC